MEKLPKKRRSKVFFSKCRKSSKFKRRKSLKSGIGSNNKANLKDLEDLIESNFTLAKKYIENIKLSKTETESKQIENAFGIIKNQVVFVAVSKGLQKSDKLYQLLKKL